jgi:hypothetical protein
MWTTNINIKNLWYKVCGRFNWEKEELDCLSMNMNYLVKNVRDGSQEQTKAPIKKLHETIIKK